jgi:hypothetical protein
MAGPHHSPPWSRGGVPLHVSGGTKILCLHHTAGWHTTEHFTISVSVDQIIFIFVKSSDTAAGPPCSVDRGMYSLCLHGEDPPPPALGSDVTPPYLQGMAVIYCDVTATWDRWSHLPGREPWLLHSHRGSMFCGRSSAVPSTISVSG